MAGEKSRCIEQTDMCPVKVYCQLYIYYGRILGNGANKNVENEFHKLSKFHRTELYYTVFQLRIASTPKTHTFFSGVWCFKRCHGNITADYQDTPIERRDAAALPRAEPAQPGDSRRRRRIYQHQ